MAEPGSQEIQTPAPTPKKETPVTPDKAPEKPIAPSDHPSEIRNEIVDEPVTSKKQWIG